MRTIWARLLFSCLLWTAGEISAQETQEVQWVNTLEPELLEGISENTPINTVLGTLLAVDPAGTSPVTYGTTSNIVSVDANTGEVSLATALDRETVSTHMVTFFANKDGLQSPVTVALLVRDENDNPPIYTNAPYAVSISEGTATRALVFDGIIASDADAGRNAELTISCIVPTGDTQAEEACRTFQPSLQSVGQGQYRGFVYLDRVLNYDYRNSYELFLRVADSAEDAFESNTTLTISVTRALPDIEPPSFVNSPFSFSVFENRPSDVPVFEIQARSRNPQLTVSFVIVIKSSTDTRNLFTLGEVVAREGGLYVAPLYVTGQLDREVISGLYVFTVQAKERVRDVSAEQVTETSVTVTVLDVNDNAPVVSVSSTALSVSESLRRDSVIPGFSIVVTDTDLGDNGFFEVHLEGEGSSSFRLSPDVASQRAEISLILLERLDFDNVNSRSMHLSVVAVETETAEQRSGQASFTVNVLDANDNNPQFQFSDYRAYIREDRAVDTSVTTIQAFDADSNAFGQITYSLRGQHQNLLYVDSQTGTVYLAESLDFETLPTFSVEFIATDGGGLSGSATLLIQVLDFNDEAPAFVVDEYRGFIKESSTVLRPNITVRAVDSESDEEITYSIIGGNVGNAFYVEPQRGTINVLRPVHYEDTNDGLITLIVEASDNGSPPQRSTVPVIITVSDENDHTPIFENNGVYRRNILETAPTGTEIVTLVATDDDTGTNGDIRYIIFSGSQDDFVIGPDSGLMTVAPDSNIDFDVQSFYEMTVYAIDAGSPQRTGQARVFVTIDDVNNKPPVFTEDLYTLTVFETVSSGTNVGNVQANDPDRTSNVQYSIDPASISARDRSGQIVTATSPINYRTLFRVDPTTGTLFTNGDLDRDYVAEVSFTVLATDMNGEDPPVQVGSAVVIITIRSTSDGGLTFDPPWTSQNPVIEIFIAEEEPVGTLITTIIAHDPETGNQVQDYRKIFESDPQEFFVVIQETGQVYLNKRMDFENPDTAQKTFRLEAYTAPPESRSAMATIIVKTLDINDHDPEFQDTQYDFDASEGLRPGDQIGVVVATDDDSDEFGRVTYSISGPGSDVFRIHPDLGYIEVRDNRSLDREWIPEFYLIVRATDQGGRYAEVPMTIAVLDENDNMPQFTSPEYNMYTTEFAQPYGSLGQVRAVDNDAGPNGAVTYRIVNGNDLGLFDIGTTTGIVRPVVDLQGYARDFPYTLTVEASDGGSEPSTSTTVIQIHVTQVENQDGRPRIEFPPENGLKIIIPENATVDTNITQIIASDSDLGPEGELEFGFVPNDALDDDQSYFSIDPETGLITISQELDRETQQQYELLIYVRDKGSPPNQVTRKIVVSVSDINDNRPKFTDNAGCPDMEVAKPMYASVAEGRDAGTYVTTVEACDPDSPPNNNIYYFIVGGNDDPQTGEPVFNIDTMSGDLTTAKVLDREVKPQYSLYVYASNVNTPPVVEPGRRRKRAIDQTDPAVQTVIITINDINDNGPVFPKPPEASQSIVVTGLASTLTYGSPVIQMQAMDADGESDYTYSIASIHYTSPSQKERQVSIAHFSINPDSGLVSTAWEDYDDYVGGSFEILVKATDSQGRTAESLLVAYVLSSNQRSKFVFDTQPEIVNSWYLEFLRKLDMYLDDGTKITADSLRYGIDKEGKAVYNRTDLCFYMVSNNQVMTQRESQKLLEDLEQSMGVVETLFQEYGVIQLDACEPHVTTKWWSDWWWLWWFLIALALFIILVTIIVIIVICCCWPKYKKAWTYIPYEKPYIILDPVNPIPTSHGYEWQEQVVNMN